MGIKSLLQIILYQTHQHGKQHSSVKTVCNNTKEIPFVTRRGYIWPSQAITGVQLKSVWSNFRQNFFIQLCVRLDI